VHGKLIADRRADQVGAIRVKAFFDQQIDLAEVDRPQVDGDFLGLAAFGAGAADEIEFGHFNSGGNPAGIHLTSNGMVIRPSTEGRQMGN
jgi:hypothetical protein